MKIVATLGGTDAGLSGLGTYVREVLPRLARQVPGGTLHVIGTPLEHEAYPELGGAERIVVDPRLDAPGLSAIWHAFRLGGFARQLDADVILLPAANRRLCIGSPVPTVAVVHDLAMLRIKGKYDALRSSYARTLVVAGLRRATSVVAVSRSTATEVARFTGRRAGGIDVIPNGVDCARFVPRPFEHSPERRPYVLYAARLEHPGKNHVRLLQAFAQSALAGTHDLVLCGEDWGAGDRIRAEIDSLGLKGCVHVLGRVPDDELVKRVQHASAVAMVGLGEGFGLPALEALACGTPVLAARAGALPEVVGDLGVLCDPLDPADMAAGLVRVTTEAVRRRARSDGPRWAKRFDWNDTAARLLEACRSVAAPSSGTHVLSPPSSGIVPMLALETKR